MPHIKIPRHSYLIYPFHLGGLPSRYKSFIRPMTTTMNAPSPMSPATISAPIADASDNGVPESAFILPLLL